MASTKQNNGHYERNGDRLHLNDSNSMTTTMGKPSASYDRTPPKEKPENAPKADRDGVAAVFSQFSQLLHVARLPIATQTSEGTFSTALQRTGLKKDFKYLHMKGMFIIQVSIGLRRLLTQQRCEDSARSCPEQVKGRTGSR